MNSQTVHLSNFAAERAAATQPIIEEIDMTYPGGLTQEEYDSEEMPMYGDSEDPDEEEQARMTTGTFAHGFDPHELDSSSARRAFCNNFSD